MEFIRTIREKQQTAREETIQKEAERTIALTDFDGNLYISYNGVPLIQIDDKYTPKDIVQELTRLRTTYIQAHKKQFSRGIAAL